MLYLLLEDKNQEDYSTEVRYLYKSDLVKRILGFLDNKHYLFLSNNYGVLSPDKVVNPYEVRDLSKDSLEIWSVCVYHLIFRYMKDNNINRICILFSGNTYTKLEGMLRKDFVVDTPLKHYTKKNVKMRWVDDYISNSVVIDLLV